MEIEDAKSFCFNLAIQSEMKVTGKGILDLGLCYLSPAYVTHHKIEQNTHDSLNHIMTVLRTSAAKLRKQTGQIH